jgi:stalled ribosome alternative rescue factor ArfA
MMKSHMLCGSYIVRNRNTAIYLESGQIKDNAIVCLVMPPLKML